MNFYKYIHPRDHHPDQQIARYRHPQASRVPPPSGYSTTSSKTNLRFSFPLLYLSEVLALFINGIRRYILSYAWLLLCLVSLKFIHFVADSNSTFFRHCSIVFQCVNIAILFLLGLGSFPIGGSYTNNAAVSLALLFGAHMWPLVLGLCARSVELPGRRRGVCFTR